MRATIYFEVQHHPLALSEEAKGRSILDFHDEILCFFASGPPLTLARKWFLFIWGEWLAISLAVFVGPSKGYGVRVH